MPRDREKELHASVEKEFFPAQTQTQTGFGGGGGGVMIRFKFKAQTTQGSPPGMTRPKEEDGMSQADSKK